MLSSLSLWRIVVSFSVNPILVDLFLFIEVNYVIEYSFDIGHNLLIDNGIQGNLSHFLHLNTFLNNPSVSSTRRYANLQRTYLRLIFRSILLPSVFVLFRKGLQITRKLIAKVIAKGYKILRFLFPLKNLYYLYISINPLVFRL